LQACARALSLWFELPAVLSTQELHDRIAACEVAGIRAAIATVRRLYPDANAEGVDIAGGLAAFTGADSPLSQVYGAGRVGPVSAAEIAEITAFFESRGATPRVYVSPLADPSLSRRLAAARYAPCEFENVLASQELDAHAARDERIRIAADPEAWARASAMAFTDRDAVGDADAAIARVLVYSPGVTALEALDDGAIAATAAMDLHGDWTGLFAGATLGPYRGRGWHTALIRDRLARAFERGARFARGHAKPGSTSERNFLRCGFSVLYTRTLWERQQPQ